ncbi:endonuclease/exonuclease/phosphatase family protein [Maritimibacter sp. UBA3975]|uniref:endonuclease/exonuclease/phosphatase family protein n=1 Tax=Maritimibacter sp. UBA3975 TaxID=1946833 RepID=UPI000C092BFE|nr:endonuclease/exonuclease/phosphatase family protein [Maritimibacter sp. UBA3975]MAM61173.1 hypothetical protein [Maritimibacter sp.]|tara:strand:- start:1101 stop:2003 length:903 start_codon:yes stop_codon:yes gene_type:complete
MKNRLSPILRNLGRVCLLLVVAGYLGRVHPAGDSVAVFRVYFAGLLVLSGVGLMIVGPRGAGAVNAALGAGIIATLGILPWGTQQDPQTGQGAVIRHYQKNLLFHNDNPVEVLEDILARDPDIVTLQEAVGRSGNVLAPLMRTYPAHIACDAPESYGLAIFARWPAIDGTAFCGDRLAGVQVEAPEGPLWVVATHLRWVWPYPNAENADAIAARIAQLDGPIALGGDFNVVPWAHSVTQIAEAGGLTRVGRSAVTFAAGGLLRVQIDHVLATGGTGRSERLPRLGSDHWGVWAEYSLTRP